MTCNYHPDVPATAYCRTCGKALCAACQRSVRGVIYCEQCIGAHVPAPAAGAPTGTATPVDNGSPSPGLAAVLGFIPGVGAMYNGQFMKALVHVLIFASLIFAAGHGAGFFGVFIPFFIFYMVFDAYKTARARELGQPLPDWFGLDRMFGGDAGTTTATPNAAATPGTPGSVPADVSFGSALPPSDVAPAPYYRGRGPIGAIILIGLGLVFLMSTMGFVDLYWVNRYIWPSALILIGVWLIVARRMKPWHCACGQCQMRHMTGPAIMITIGALWILSEMSWRTGWDRTWPVLLIVIGVMVLMRHSASAEGHINWRDRMHRFSNWTKCPACGGASVQFDDMGRARKCETCGGKGVVPGPPPPPPGTASSQTSTQAQSEQEVRNG
jgi:TM2 domain-containing membrane protein YozV